MHTPSLSAVDVNLLVVLHALLLERHVTRAAHRLGLSQSATSHALSRLRALFGDELLSRSGRNLLPTPRAERLLPQLERAIGELSGVIRGEPAFDPKTARRSFRVGAADYVQALFLEPLFAHLSREAPFVDLHVLMAPNLPELLESGSLDLALLVPSSATVNLHTERLLTEHFVCILRKGHPAARGGFDLDKYLRLGHVLVAPSGSPGSIVDTELARRGLRRRVALSVPSFLVAPLVVAGSDFVNTGPERLARRMEKLLPLKILPPPLKIAPFELHLCSHQRVAGDPAHRWLVQTIKYVARTLSASD